MPHPAHRAQAVARVHRMKQQRETRTYRFIVDDTIEAVLHRLNLEKAAQLDTLHGAAGAGGHDTGAPLMLSDVVRLLSDT